MKNKTGTVIRPLSEGDILRRQLRGKVVKSIRLQPFDDGRGEKAFDPVIIFTDGSALGFNVQETEIGEYGVQPLFHDATFKSLSHGWEPGDQVEHVETGERREIRKVQSREMGTVVLGEPIEGLKTFQERELDHVPTITRGKDRGE